MRQFSYTQIILKHPIIYAPTLTCKQMDDIFDDYESFDIKGGTKYHSLERLELRGLVHQMIL